MNDDPYIMIKFSRYLKKRPLFLTNLFSSLALQETCDWFNANYDSAKK